MTSIIDIGANEDGECSVYVYGRKRDPYVPWKPSADWSQGGPIIEREKIWLKFPVAVGPVEAIHGLHLFPNTVHGFGPTPLIAAMRCYVVSKLGHEIEIPEDIL